MEDHSSWRIVHSVSKKFTLLVFSVAEAICKKMIMFLSLHSKTNAWILCTIMRKSWLRNYFTRHMENDVTQRSIQISSNQPAQKVPVQKVTSTRFHAAIPTFASLIDIVVDHCRWNPWKRRRLPGNARYMPIDLNKLDIAKTRIQVIWCKPLKNNSWAYCNHESFLNLDVSMFHCCIKKIESRLES